MATGIIRRYKVAGVPPPVILYTDRDCCGEKKVSSLFTTWQELNVCLDAWHFMQRLRDVLTRIEEVKPYITSTFGSVLKIDSTKKVKYYKQINYQVTLSLYINSNLLFGNTDISPI